MRKWQEKDEGDLTENTSSSFFFEHQIDFSITISAIKKFPLVFLGCILTGIALAVSYFFFAVPLYRAEVTLYPNENTMLRTQGLTNDVSSLRNLISLGSGNVESGNRVTPYLATLNSRSFIISFLEEKELIGSLARLEEEQSNEGARVKAYERFKDEHLEVERDRLTGLIYLRVSWSDKELAAVWANELIRRLNDQLRREYIDVAERKIAYINSVVNDASVSERRALLLALAEQEERKVVIARGEDDFGFKILDPAIAPIAPVHPKLVVLLPIGLAVGTLSGVALSVFAAARR